MCSASLTPAGSSKLCVQERIRSSLKGATLQASYWHMPLRTPLSMGSRRLQLIELDGELQ